MTISSPANPATFASGTPITFSGSATDADSGDLTDSLTWTSNLSGQIGTGGSFDTVLSSGTHIITASVTDSGGLPGSATVTITVTPSSPIALSVRAYKIKNAKYADLTWTGASSDNVDVYRNGSRVTTTPNDGAYKDTAAKTATSATYWVCETGGTSNCSNVVTVTW